MSFKYQDHINVNEPNKSAELEIDATVLPGGKQSFISQDRTLNNTGYTLYTKGNTYYAYKMDGSSFWENRNTFVKKQESSIAEGIKKRKTFRKKSLKKRKTFRKTFRKK